MSCYRWLVERRPLWGESKEKNTERIPRYLLKRRKSSEVVVRWEGTNGSLSSFNQGEKMWGPKLRGHNGGGFRGFTTDGGVHVEADRQDVGRYKDEVT